MSWRSFSRPASTTWWPAGSAWLPWAPVVGRPDFEPLAVAFKRAVNIIEKQAKDVTVGGVDPSLFQEDAERELHRAHEFARGRVEGAVGRGDFEGALREITALKPAVDEFFDQVRVLAEDPQVKANRISLLAAIGRLFGGIADFSKIHIAGELRSWFLLSNGARGSRDPRARRQRVCTACGRGLALEGALGRHCSKAPARARQVDPSGCGFCARALNFGPVFRSHGNQRENVC